MEKHFQKNKPEMATNNLDTVNNGYSEVERNHTRYFQKWRFKNRARFKRSLISIFTLFVVSFASCGASDKPTEPDRLPFGVFPLNDVKWVHTGHYMLEGFNNEGTKYIIEDRYDTGAIFVRQISENQAELYAKGIAKLVREGWEFIDGGMKELKFEDSVWTFGPNLLGHIHLEHKKVYYQRTGKEKELLYDFNLRLNDTTTFGDPYYTAVVYFVASIDSAKLGNEYRKRYRFKSVCGGWSFSVIEGIGNDISFSYPLLSSIERSHNKDRLRGVYYKDKLIWGYDILGNKGE